jgi:hypothetical protein
MVVGLHGRVVAADDDDEALESLIGASGGENGAEMAPGADKDGVGGKDSKDKTASPFCSLYALIIIGDAAACLMAVATTTHPMLY